MLKILNISISEEHFDFTFAKRKSPVTFYSKNKGAFCPLR